MKLESILPGFVLASIVTLYFCLAVLLLAQSVIGCSERQTPPKGLTETVERGTVEDVEKLLRSGVDINQLEGGKTPLQTACSRGDLAIVRLLLANGADVRIRSDKGYEALHYAVYWGNTELAKLLIDEYGADVRARSNKGLEPLHNAAYNGHWQVAQLLILKGADINAKRNDGDTPLHAAALKDRRSFTQNLIQADADTEARNEAGCTPLYTAVKRMHYKVAQLLLEAGADPMAACNDGSTPLQLASDKKTESGWRSIFGWKKMESLLAQHSVSAQ